VAALPLVVSLAGCTSPNKEDPMPTEIPTQVRANAESVCGLDRADAETATGLQIGHVEGDLGTADADGKRECEIWPTDSQWVDGAMLFVTVQPAPSDEGKRLRAQVDGTAPGVIEPSVRYGGLDGAAWSGTAGAVSNVFVGDQVISLTSTWAGEGRDPLKDLPALSQQVASSQGLGQ
jgi:hypothetical protein